MMKTHRMSCRRRRQVCSCPLSLELGIYVPHPGPSQEQKEKRNISVTPSSKEDYWMPSSLQRDPKKTKQPSPTQTGSCLLFQDQVGKWATINAERPAPGTALTMENKRPHKKPSSCSTARELHAGIRHKGNHRQRDRCDLLCVAITQPLKKRRHRTSCDLKDQEVEKDQQKKQWRQHNTKSSKEEFNNR